jgi:hypothetical protein
LFYSSPQGQLATRRNTVEESGASRRGETKMCYS